MAVRLMVQVQRRGRPLDGADMCFSLVSFFRRRRKGRKTP